MTGPTGADPSAPDGIDAMLDEATAEPPTTDRSWWRRNRIALVVFVVLAAVTTGVVWGNAWLGYYEGRPSIADRVVEGQPVQYAGATWTLQSLERLDPDDPAIDAGALPAGTVPVVAQLRIEPGAATPLCTIALVEHRPGAADRSWSDDFGSLWAEFDETRETGCSSEATGPYVAELAFVMPADAGRDLAITVEVGDGLPRYLVLGGD